MMDIQQAKNIAVAARQGDPEGCAELEALEWAIAELEEYKRDMTVNTFEDTEPSVAVHFFPSHDWLLKGSGMTSDCMYVSKKDFDKYIFDSKCWHRAYNDRINALAAELARVKAESLRVVELPADYEFMSDWYMTPDGLGWNSSDRHGDSCVETPDGYHQFVDCKKVRIERWETSDE